MLEQISVPSDSSELPRQVLALFDAVAQPAQISPNARLPLQLAALAFSSAIESGAEQPDRVGRDLLLAADLPDVEIETRCLAASIIAFQRGKIRAHRETAFLRLSRRDQALTKPLAAILSLVNTLGAQVSDLLIQVQPNQVVLVCPESFSDARLEALDQAVALWRQAIGPLAFVRGDPTLASSLGAVPLSPPSDILQISFAGVPIPTTLVGDEPITEGIRRMLRRHFEKMLAREENVRNGDDPEDIHQMRVATRRLRASLQIVAPLYRAKPIKHFRNQLREVASALGEVRDRDVFLENLRSFQGADLAKLIAALEEQRVNAKEQLLDDFDTKTYERFKHAFARFLTTPNDEITDGWLTGTPPRVRDAAGSMIWQRYEQLRAFEVVIPQGEEHLLHQARIAGKRLRYTLELFEDVLGDRFSVVYDPLVSLQECLGNLQDAVVARETIATLGLADDPGAQDYLEARHQGHDTELEQLPRVWEKVNSGTYRRRLFELLVKI